MHCEPYLNPATQRRQGRAKRQHSLLLSFFSANCLFSVHIGAIFKILSGDNLITKKEKNTCYSSFWFSRTNNDKGQFVFGNLIWLYRVHKPKARSNKKGAAIDRFMPKKHWFFLQNRQDLAKTLTCAAQRYQPLALLSLLYATVSYVAHLAFYSDWETIILSFNQNSLVAYFSRMSRFIHSI